MEKYPFGGQGEEKRWFSLAESEYPTNEELCSLGFNSPGVILGIYPPNGKCFFPSDYFRVEATGEFRQPKMGEWYISGAIPEAYKAKSNGIRGIFHIGVLIKVLVETKTTKITKITKIV